MEWVSVEKVASKFKRSYWFSYIVHKEEGSFLLSFVVFAPSDHVDVACILDIIHLLVNHFLEY